MNPTPLNTEALEAAADELRDRWDGNSYDGGRDEIAEAIVTAYLAALPATSPQATSKPNQNLELPRAVTSVESFPAKMRMLMWEGGEFEVGEIPEGHVLVGFEMATDRAWSMADKVTIHIERPEES